MIPKTFFEQVGRHKRATGHTFFHTFWDASCQGCAFKVILCVDKGNPFGPMHGGEFCVAVDEPGATGLVWFGGKHDAREQVAVEPGEVDR